MWPIVLQLKSIQSKTLILINLIINIFICTLTILSRLIYIDNVLAFLMKIYYLIFMYSLFYCLFLHTFCIPTDLY